MLCKDSSVQRLYLSILTKTSGPVTGSPGPDFSARSAAQTDTSVSTHPASPPLEKNTSATNCRTWKLVREKAPPCARRLRSLGGQYGSRRAGWRGVLAAASEQERQTHGGDEAVDPEHRSPFLSGSHHSIETSRMRVGSWHRRLHTFRQCLALAAAPLAAVLWRVGVELGYEGIQFTAAHGEGPSYDVVHLARCANRSPLDRPKR